LFRRIARGLASLRWRLTLTYVALIAVLLAGLGAYEFFALRGSLVTNRVAALQSDFDTARVLIARQAVARPAATVRALCTQAPALAGKAVAQFIAQASGHSVDIVVYTPSLAVAAAMPANADLPRLSPTSLQRVLSTHARSGAEEISTPDGDALVVGFPVAVANNVCGIAQLSTPMTPINAVLADDVKLLGLGGGAVLLVALALGLVLTGRTLRPLRRLTETAEQLAAGDLRARSRLTPRNDEVGTLAGSFDNMADRIEASFAAQHESEAQVRRFIADASHELRTPVTALKGYIDVLRRGAARDPATLDAALEAMGRESERMRELVLDLLTLARLDARREINPETIDVNAELSDILDEGVPDMPATVERDFAASPLTVRADRGALRTIVRNVLVNACKYAPGAAQRWSTSVDQGRARVDMHDDGPGISPMDLPHVFERFYRGEKTRAREEGGSGLGLSIVQGLVRAQGGEVAIQSAEGSGTTVSVWLPLATQPA
jgi:two-component system OmpR family sensor kinase